MNFLAHILLSGDKEKMVIGNFIGDFVKGKQIENYEKEIKNGILLHREIDSFTDDHPIVLESKKRLWDRFHHYAAIVVDVFYDHFLATNWEEYKKTSLLKFTEDFYGMTKSYHGVIPERAKKMLFYMERDNWLYSYRLVDGIQNVLTGMSRRTKFESGMENAHVELRNHYHEFQSEFNDFFPQLMKHSNDFISTLDP